MGSSDELIDPEMAYEYFQEGRAQMVDARPRLAYEQTRERIPGAIHIEPDLGAATTEALLALPRERPIIAYCDQPAQAASLELARRVRALGHGDGYAIAGGLRAWKQAGLPIEMAPPLVSPRRKNELAASHVVELTATGVDIHVRAPSLVTLFEEAALGLADAVGVPQLQREPTDHLVAFRARDREALLLVWLQELLARTAEERRLFVEVAIDTVSDHELRARVRGADVAEWRLHPRAEALSVAPIERQPGSYETVLTLAP
jgi:rhodanese-related sulfurtransferase/SHS2 domain-containing protein